MGFFDDLKFFFGKRCEEKLDSFTPEDYRKLELQMHQQQQNMNTPILSKSEVVEWKKVLDMLKEPPYNLLHVWASEEQGWAYISFEGKRQKLSFTDNLEKIKNLCDIVLK